VIRIVLVATDGSEASETAVQTAIDLTKSLGPDARLHVASVVDYAGVPEILAKRPPDAPDLLADEADAAISAAMATVAESGLEAESHLLHGDVVGALLARAADVGADIMVAGFHGRNRFARLVMGNVVGHLVRSTDLPVVVVRSPES